MLSFSDRIAFFIYFFQIFFFFKCLRSLSVCLYYSSLQVGVCVCVFVSVKVLIFLLVAFCVSTSLWWQMLQGSSTIFFLQFVDVVVVAVYLYVILFCFAFLFYEQRTKLSIVTAAKKFFFFFFAWYTLDINE